MLWYQSADEWPPHIVRLFAVAQQYHGHSCLFTNSLTRTVLLEVFK